MSNLLDLIKTRRSVRKYKDKHVERDKIKKIMEAARWAPSSHNSQPWKFFVIENKGKEEALVDATYGQEFVGDAPIIILACGDHNKSEDCEADTALAIENLVLEAHNLGLGTCIIGYFDREIAKSIFKLEEDLTVYYLITLGYSDENPKEKKRKPLEEVYEFLED